MMPVRAGPPLLQQSPMQADDPTPNGRSPVSRHSPKHACPSQRAYRPIYNVTIERQQWDTGFRISYLGTNTRQGVYGYNYNSPVPDSRPYISKPRPFPTLPDVRFTTNGAGHQY